MNLSVRSIQENEIQVQDLDQEDAYFFIQVVDPTFDNQQSQQGEKERIAAIVAGLLFANERR